jgi:DNA-binding transcriptional ArsR family regulator
VKVTGELAEKIIASLADIESRRIISATLEKPKTAVAIEAELNLPHTTLYRKITELRECGLLMVDNFALRPDGKREAVYACSFAEIHFRTDQAGIELEIVQSARSLERRWFELFFSKRNVSSPETPSAASGSFEPS